MSSFRAPSPPMRPTSIRLLTFNDSIEYMINPWKALEAAKELLTERGVIVVSVPNVRQFSVIRMLVFDASGGIESPG